MTRRPSPLAATYTLVALLAAATLTLPGARTTLAAGWHVIDPSRLPGEWHGALFLGVTVLVLGVVLRRRYYVAGWWR